ncbi:MAG: sigma-70 family RNA polymerase sigma factor [Coriobacteriia bacterium]|nr:sigma-70 family RNA polymerase sigma factor [Coriobacteriia bacterium]
MAVTERALARIVSKARNGDANAFERLYDEYADRVYAFVRSRTASSHDAEDVTATVFLKAWKAIGTYDERGIPFSAWLFRIARNAIVDEHRRSEHRPLPVEDTGGEDEAVSGPEEAVLAAAGSQKVRSAIRTLTEEQASVIALRFWWDLSLKETAEAMGRNENAVKALQHRAIKSLARVLQEDGNDEAE